MSAPYWADESVTLWHGDALDLPLEDATVDLVVTSPPYFGLRSYQDAGEHYAGQIASAMQVDKVAPPIDDQGVLDFGGAA